MCTFNRECIVLQFYSIYTCSYGFFCSHHNLQKRHFIIIISIQMPRTMLYLIFSVVSLNGNDNVKEIYSDSIIYKNYTDGSRHC